jgi:hypothetical protein
MVAQIWRSRGRGGRRSCEQGEWAGVFRSDFAPVKFAEAGPLNGQPVLAGSRSCTGADFDQIGAVIARSACATKQSRPIERPAARDCFAVARNDD